MIKKATATVLTLLWTAAGALAQQAPEEVTDNVIGPAKPATATIWVNVVIAMMLLLGTLFVAFRDPRRTHLDEQK